MKFLRLLLLLPALAFGQTYYNQTTIPPNNSFYRVFDVANYGAKCDGNAIDTAAFVAASAAATVNGGGQILIPPRNCVIDNTTTIGSNVTVSGYGATITPVVSGSWAGSATQQAFVLAANATNVTIQGINFNYPSSGYGGACHIIESYTTNSKIVVKDNTSNYCGDLMANIGSSYVLMTNNQAYNAANSCYDNWHGATNVAVTDNFCSLVGTSAGIFFTGYHNPGPTGDLNNGLIATGNTIVELAAAEVGIEVNGNDGNSPGTCTGPATDDNGVIADNHIYMPSGFAGYGILIRFCANNWDVHDNVITGDGSTDQAKDAISALTIATNVMIHNNLVSGWVNSTSSTEKGAFKNTSVGGTLMFNECYGCTLATAVVGLTDSTTLVLGNDTGTGVFTLSSVISTGNITAGASSQIAWSGNGILTSPAPGDIHLGDVDSATPVNQILAAQSSRSGTDSNVAGANVLIATGRGTGNATGASLTLSTPNPTSSGTGAQAFVPGLSLTAPVIQFGNATSNPAFSFLGSGTVAHAGLITGAAGLTILGAATSLNDSSNFNTTINTGTSTGSVTIGQNSSSPSSIALKGPVSFQAGTTFSGASWTTTSPVLNGVAMTLNDTTASGTVTTEAGYSLQPVTFTSTGGASTTITNAVGLWIGTPACSGGVVCGSSYSLYSNGRIFANGITANGTLQLNVSNNAATNIGTGTTSSLVSIGGGSDGVAINSGLSTGFVKDTALISTGTKFTATGTGACSTITTTLGGASAGSFLCTGTAGASTATITINGASGLTAPTGWACSGGDVTSGVAWGPSGAASTTTGTISGAIGVTSDRVVFSCVGY